MDGRTPPLEDTKAQGLLGKHEELSQLESQVHGVHE